MFYAILVVVVIGIAIAWYVSTVRRKKLAAWAATRGLRFDPRSDGLFDDVYPEFGCLRIGRGRRASNISSGTMDGRSVVSFDYRYVTGSGKSQQVHTFSGVILGSDLSLKPLYIRSETFFDKVGEFLGLDDIDFESAEFSRAFHVKSPDKRWAFDVLHQRTIEFLLAQPRFSIQFGSGRILVWRRRRFSPQTFDDAIRVGAGILDRMPRYIARQGGER